MRDPALLDPRAAPLQVLDSLDLPIKISESRVGLLQMTVLPYIVFSLIANIGRLSFGESKRLVASALSVMFALWAVGALVILLASFAFPPWPRDWECPTSPFPSPLPRPGVLAPITA